VRHGRFRLWSRQQGGIGEQDRLVGTLQFRTRFDAQRRGQQLTAFPERGERLGLAARSV
jgi:hypothetical protein